MQQSAPDQALRGDMEIGPRLILAKEIMITAPNKTRAGFGSGSLTAQPTDIKQPSGCFISG